MGTDEKQDETLISRIGTNFLNTEPRIGTGYGWAQMKERGGRMEDGKKGFFYGLTRRKKFMGTEGEKMIQFRLLVEVT